MPFTPEDWISVEDRLPTDDDEVVTYQALDEDIRRGEPEVSAHVDLGYYQDGQWFHVSGVKASDRYCKIVVTHWAPMPMMPAPKALS